MSLVYDAYGALALVILLWLPIAWRRSKQQHLVLKHLQNPHPYWALALLAGVQPVTIQRWYRTWTRRGWIEAHASSAKYEDEDSNPYRVLTYEGRMALYVWWSRFRRRTCFGLLLLTLAAAQSFFMLQPDTHFWRLF